MGVQERRARQKESVRREILTAARELFVKEGYQNVSMRRIAEKIEYSPTTIYLYFKDKAELVDALCAETFSGLVAEMDKVKQLRTEDPIQALRAGLRAYVDFGLNFPNHYRVTFMTGPEVHDDFERHLRPDSMGMRAFSILRDCVAECVRQGKFASADVDSASQALWAAVHGITSLLIAKDRFPWTDQQRVVSLVIDSMIGGLER